MASWPSVEEVQIIFPLRSHDFTEFVPLPMKAICSMSMYKMPLVDTEKKLKTGKLVLLEEHWHICNDLQIESWHKNFNF